MPYRRLDVPAKRGSCRAASWERHRDRWASRLPHCCKLPGPKLLAGMHLMRLCGHGWWHALCVCPQMQACPALSASPPATAPAPMIPRAYAFRSHASGRWGRTSCGGRPQPILGLPTARWQATTAATGGGVGGGGGGTGRRAALMRSTATSICTCKAPGSHGEASATQRQASRGGTRELGGTCWPHLPHRARGTCKSQGKAS